MRSSATACLAPFRGFGEVRRRLVDFLYRSPLRARIGAAANREYRRIAEELLAEAERIDNEEDERFGKDRRGDELPEQLRTREGRQAALRQAKLELDSEHDEPP